MHSNRDNTPATSARSKGQTVQDYDVIVIGGGTSGLIAAIQAARAGANTLLVEKSGLLGGTTTLAGVNVPGIFHAWGRQVIAGIGWELVNRTQLLAGKPLPDFHNWHNKRHWELCVVVNVAVYCALADNLLKEAGAKLWLHSMLAAVEYDAGGKRWHLSVCRKEGLQSIRTKVLIDCSGDANAVHLAGLPTQRSPVLQPGTLMLYAGGYEIENIDLPALEAAFAEEVARGTMLRSDFYTEHNPVGCFLRNRGRNAMHVIGIDASTSDGKTQAELKARETMLRIVCFLRKHKGLENFTIEQMAPECGIRESVTIEGDMCIRSQDYTSGHLWPDSLCYSFFPIDIHNSDGGGGYLRPIPEGVVPTIPLRAQLPRNSERIIVAGRTLCGEREASSSLRVQATAMATGQVAGAVASLAAQQDCDLRDVPLESVKDLLRAHNAIVPEAKPNALPLHQLQNTQALGQAT